MCYMCVHVYVFVCLTIYIYIICEDLFTIDVNNFRYGSLRFCYREDSVLTVNHISCDHIMFLLLNPKSRFRSVRDA